VPKLAADHLGLPINGGKSLTLLGGLTSFGGAGNNYSMHVGSHVQTTKLKLWSHELIPFVGSNGDGAPAA